jgi:hypothetical protein
MKALRLRLELDEESIHPMHDLVARRDDFERTDLLHYNPALEGTNAMIFRVVGDDPAGYESALGDLDSVRDHHVSRRDDDIFYAYVRERQSPADAALVGAFTRRSLVVVPPIEYRSDRSMVFTFVGESGAMQNALAETPPDVRTDVLRVGEYDGGVVDPTVRLTPRQREAVEAAVDVGYYGATREGSVADVGAKLDCSPATAAEHLRKAEATLARWAVERRF